MLQDTKDHFLIGYMFEAIKHILEVATPGSLVHREAKAALEKYYEHFPQEAPAAAAPAAPLVTGTPLEQLRQVVARENFVILDTETTGLDDGEICQIAIIDHLGIPLLYSHVKTARPIPADASRIHGIYDHDVADAPTYPLLAPEIKRLLTGKDVIVYNAVYDRKMLHKSAERHGMEKIDWKAISPWYCAMEAYAEYYGEWNDYRGSYRWQKLTDAARRCGCLKPDAHDAYADCLMTLGVIRTMFKAGE
jgi:DNA polymerase-3 subunit epsilon